MSEGMYRFYGLSFQVLIALVVLGITCYIVFFKKPPREELSAAALLELQLCRKFNNDGTGYYNHHWDFLLKELVAKGYLRKEEHLYYMTDKGLMYVQVNLDV